MVKAVFFDLWNTILCCSTKNKVDEIISVLGLSGKVDYCKVMEDMDSKLFVNAEYDIETFLRELCDTYRVRYGSRTLSRAANVWRARLKEAEFFPETKAVLSELKKDYKIGLISNTDRSGAVYAKNVLKLGRYFDSMILSYEVGRVKPDPMIFKIALDDVGADPKESWMVGDSPRMDIEGARSAGMNAVLIDRSGITRREKYPVIKNLNELKDIIK